MSETTRVSGIMRRAVIGVSRKLILDVNRHLAENTPIDTGWARSNWIPTKDRPLTEPVGDRENVDLAAAASGVAEIKSWDLFKGSAFITNNVPYINDLNAGTSPQASPGFVQASIEQGITGLTGERLR